MLDCCERRTEEEEPQYFGFLAMQNDCLPSGQMTRVSDTCVLLCIFLVLGRQRIRNISRAVPRHYYCCCNFCSLARRSFPQPLAEQRPPLAPLKALEPRNFGEILPLYCNCGNLFYKEKYIDHLFCSN